MRQKDKDVMNSWIDGKKEITAKPSGFYVYVATFNGIIYYVGKGSNSRYTHCNSGKSGNPELNRLHFAGVRFNVLLAQDGLTEDESFKLELELIKKLKPLYNQKCNNPTIGASGSKVKGSFNNRCNHCGNKFSRYDTLPGLIDDTINSGTCQTCRNWKSEDDDY